MLCFTVSNTDLKSRQAISVQSKNEEVCDMKSIYYPIVPSSPTNPSQANRIQTNSTESNAYYFDFTSHIIKHFEQRKYKEREREKSANCTHRRSLYIHETSQAVK